MNAVLSRNNGVRKKRETNGCSLKRRAPTLLVTTMSLSLPHRCHSSSPATPSPSNLPGIQAVRCCAVHVGVALDAALHRLGVPAAHRDDGGDASLESRQVHEVVALEQALSGEAQAAKAARTSEPRSRVLI